MKQSWKIHSCLHECTRCVRCLLIIQPWMHLSSMKHVSFTNSISPGSHLVLRNGFVEEERDFDSMDYLELRCTRVTLNCTIVHGGLVSQSVGSPQIWALFRLIHLWLKRSLFSPYLHLNGNYKSSLVGAWRGKGLTFDSILSRIWLPNGKDE